MSLLCSFSERIHRYPPEEQPKFSFALLKTLINLINFNNSSTSHCAKVTLRDFTDLHMKIYFYGRVKVNCWKGKEWGAIIEYLNYFIFIIVGGQNQNSPNVYLCIYTHSGENIYLIPCWFCTFAHWQRNDQSIILMLGLFEQWETEQQQQQKIQKNVFQKSYKLICILMSQICLDPPV